MQHSNMTPKKFYTKNLNPLSGTTLCCLILIALLLESVCDTRAQSSQTNNHRARFINDSNNNNNNQKTLRKNGSINAHPVTGSASFNLPELNDMASECLVRASCKLRHQRQLRPQVVPDLHGAAADPAARIVSCYCDNKCHLYDDCCSDAQDFASSRTSPNDESVNHDPSSSSGNSDTSHGEISGIEDESQDETQRVAEARQRWHCQRINGNLGGMQLLAECPPNWADELPEITDKLAKFIERRCTFVANPIVSTKESNDSLLADYQSDPLGMMMPITDLRTGITYANSYCLRCNRHSRLFGIDWPGRQNGQSKLVSWSPVLDCNYDSEHDDRNSLYDLITQHKGNALQYNHQLNKWTVNTKLLEEEVGVDATTTPSVELISESPTFQSEVSTTPTQSTNTSSIERICTIAPTVPDEVRPHLRYCHSNSVRACGLSSMSSGGRSRTSSALSRVCQFGPQSLLFSKTSDRVYHNLACALCNGENTTSIDCFPSRRRHMMAAETGVGSGSASATSLQKLFPESLSPLLQEARSASPFATSFSILFDLSGQANAAVPGSINRCKGMHQVYDPFFMTCRCLLCGLNREYRDGKCVTKLHMMAENMAFSPMPMKMLPTSRSSRDTDSDGSKTADSSDSEVALNSPTSNDFNSARKDKQSQIGLQMLIPRDMPELTRPINSRLHHNARSSNKLPESTSRDGEANELNNNNNNNAQPVKRMTDLDSEFEKILMKLALDDLPEPSVDSREKFALCGKLTVMPQHYRLFTLSDRLLIGPHSKNQARRGRNMQAGHTSTNHQNEAENTEDETAFMLLNDQDQKHQKRRHARSGTYALRIWAYVRPYNLLLPSSQFELIRPDSIIAEYEMAGIRGDDNASVDLSSDGAGNGGDQDGLASDQRFDLLICAPFKNDLGQKFSLEMAYVTSVCLTISIASLTLYLMLYVFSMFNLRRLVKAQHDNEQNYHKLSMRSDISGLSQQSSPQVIDNFPDSPCTLKQLQLQQAKQHPLGAAAAVNCDPGQHPRTKRILSEAPSTFGLYSSSSCRRKSLSSQGVACLASSLLAAYLLFILNNRYVANKKDAILSQVPNPNLSSLSVNGLAQQQQQQSTNVQTDWGCKLMALSTTYCFLVAFHWMLLLSYDIWRSVRLATVHLRPPSSNYNGKRFMSYLTFSLVCSGAIVGLALLIDEMPQLCMDESGNFSCSVIELTINNFVRDFRPHFGYSGPTGVCWFNSRKSLALFFGFPVTVIVAINLIYFVLCSFMVIKTTRRSTRNSQKANSKYHQHTTNNNGTIMNLIGATNSQHPTRRPSISEQPKFVVHRTRIRGTEPEADPFARRAHHMGDQANIFGSKRSATTMQSSLGGCSYLSTLNSGSNTNVNGGGNYNGPITSSSTESSSASGSTIDDGEVTPPIDSLLLVGLHNNVTNNSNSTLINPQVHHPHLSMAEIIKAANNNAQPPTFEELDAAGLTGLYQTQASNNNQMNNRQPSPPPPNQHFRLEAQTSSNSLISNSSCNSMGPTTTQFKSSIAAKYDARKNQISSMMNTVIQDYRLYCRLSTIMGLTWLIGIMAAIVDKSMLLWHLFIIFNTLQGLFIFIAFGLKREKLRNVNILICYCKFRLRKFWLKRLSPSVEC